MHWLLVPVCTLLAACSAPAPVVGLVGADLVSMMVFGRGLADLGVSAISGRDCSVVRLDRGQTYCAPIPAVTPELYCTRSLASADCWASPALLPRPPEGIGDTPPANAAQERYRTARWPKSLFAP